MLQLGPNTCIVIYDNGTVIHLLYQQKADEDVYQELLYYAIRILFCQWV
jgi:hypothetical protein